MLANFWKTLVAAMTAFIVTFSGGISSTANVPSLNPTSTVALIATPSSSITPTTQVGDKTTITPTSTVTPTNAVKKRILVTIPCSGMPIYCDSDFKATIISLCNICITPTPSCPQDGNERVLCLGVQAGNIARFAAERAAKCPIPEYIKIVTAVKNDKYKNNPNYLLIQEHCSVGSYD